MRGRGRAEEAHEAGPEAPGYFTQHALPSGIDLGRHGERASSDADYPQAMNAISDSYLPVDLTVGA
jgi:hypothetical protein